MPFFLIPAMMGTTLTGSAATTAIMADLAITTMAVGGGLQYMGQKEQAKAESSMYKHNALVEERNADYARAADRENQLARRKQMRQVLSAQRAAYGKSGVQMVGSPIEMQLQTLSDFEVDIAKESWDSEIGARRMESSAAIETMKAKQSRKAGKFAAGNALFGGAAQMASFGVNYKLAQG